MTWKQVSKKRRFTFADWCILGILAVGILLGVWYVGFARQKAEPQMTVRYTVCIPSVKDDYLIDGDGNLTEHLKVGSAVYSENGTSPLGRVIEVELRAHLVAGVHDGEVVFAETPGVLDVYVTVEGQGSEKEGDGIRISDIRIAANLSGAFRFGGYYASYAEIRTVERVTENGGSLNETE